ncbi:MAG: SOS response-associated peptidase [Bacteroidales bacterium]|nr:SOS response-associated peptidase [Bacteroidales bacterium]
MCFHNSLSVDAQKIENRFNAHFEKEFTFKPVYHASGFTYPTWPVVISENPQNITEYKWGLIPYWAKTMKEAIQIRALTLNAKSETLFSKPSFRFSVMTKRCLVPSTGFFEWQHNKNIKKPFFITPGFDEIMAMGGLYSKWTCLESGQVFNTFSIVTTQANLLMSEIHNTKKRMPLILEKENEKQWLDMSLSEKDVQTMLKPLPDGFLKAFTVSKLVSNPNANTNVPEVQKPFNYPQILEMF